MAQPLKQFFTPDEYFFYEDRADYKSEYSQGQIYMMAGGSPEHSLIAANITTILNIALANSNCRTYNSDLKVGSKPKGFFTYPDVTVVCGKLEFVEERSDTITNPKVIVEILSPSTNKYDRTTKFDFYKDLDQFETYILIDSTKPEVEIRQRVAEQQWIVQTYNTLEQTFKITSLGLDLEIKLVSIYAKVEFETSQK
jgi:Uma2 family endonuclease